MNDIVAALYFDCLTNNTAYEEFEEEVPLQQPRSPLNILTHGCGALRRLLYRETFDDLPTLLLPENAGVKVGTTLASWVGTTVTAGCGASGFGGA